MNKHWLFVHLQCFVFDGTPFCICWCVVNQSLLTHNINSIHSNYFSKRFCVCFCALVSSKAKNNNNAQNPQIKNKPSKTHSQPPTTKHKHKSTSNQPFQRHQQRQHRVTRNKEQQSKKQKDEQTTREQRKDWRDNGSTEDAGKQTSR